MKTVGFLIEETEHFLRSDVFCAPIALAAEARLADLGHAIRLIDPARPLEDLAGLDGVIFLQAKSAELTAELDRRLPLVALLPDLPSPPPSSILIDDQASGRMAARHLLASGGKRFAVATGEEESGAIPEPYRRRIAGFRETAEAAGAKVEVHAAPFHHVAGTSGATASRPVGDKIGLILLSRSNELDGVFAVNDYIAAEIVIWLRDSNVPVPDRVQAIGCDNLPTRDAQISTVHVSKTLLGATAAEMIAEKMTGGEAPTRTLDPRLLERGTTRRPEPVRS